MIDYHTESLRVNNYMNFIDNTIDKFWDKESKKYNGKCVYDIPKDKYNDCILKLKTLRTIIYNYLTNMLTVEETKEINELIKNKYRKLFVVLNENLLQMS